ncbi:SURF1 family protein [Pandoraea terrae]
MASGVALTAALGFWQYGRAQTRLAHQARIERWEAAPVVPIGTEPVSLADVEYHRVRISGQFLGNRVVYLDNRPRNEQPGFYVVMALEISPGHAVLVNRGWLPRDLRDRTAIMPYPTPQGAVTIDGIAQADPSRAFELGNGSVAGTPIRQNLDVAAYAKETGLVLQPFVVMQTSALDDRLLRDWPAPASGANRNFGYMAQWFAMSLVLAIMGLRLAYRRGRMLAAGSTNAMKEEGTA